MNGGQQLERGKVSRYGDGNEQKKWNVCATSPQKEKKEKKRKTEDCMLDQKGFFIVRGGSTVRLEYMQSCGY